MEVAKLTLLLHYISFLTTSSYALEQTHYVKPDPNTSCPTGGQHCHMLVYYIENAEQYFTSNTTMIFLPGTHQLSMSTLINISNIEHFALVGSGGFDNASEVWHGIPEPPAEICCTEAAAFIFDSVNNLSLANITFTNCGGTVLPTAWATLYLQWVLDLNMEGVVVQNSSGYGILGYNLLGNVSIHKSTLKYNGAIGNLGSNMRLDCSDCVDNNQSLTLTIHSSRFLLGYSVNADAAGFSLYFFGSCYTAIVNVSEVFFYGNRAIPNGIGGNMLVWIGNDDASDIEICIHNSLFLSGEAYNGAGMSLVISKTSPSHEQPCIASNIVHLHVMNSSFLANHAIGYGGGLFLHLQHDPCREVRVDISDVTMEMNTAGVGGGGLAVNDLSGPTVCTATQICIYNSTFVAGEGSVGGGILVRHYSTDTTIDETCSTSRTFLLLIESTRFLANLASGDGGGLYLFFDAACHNVKAVVDYCTFENDQASNVGGAIAVADFSRNRGSTSVSIRNCLVSGGNARLGGGIMFQLSATQQSSSMGIISDSVITNNSATEAGGGMFVSIAASPHAYTTCTPSANIELYLLETVIADNTANQNGGGLVLDNDISQTCIPTEFHIVGCNFRSNQAGYNAGNILLYDSTQTLTVTIQESSVTRGQAQTVGGILYSAHLKPLQCNCTFHTESQRVLFINSTQFSGNQANESAADIHIYTSTQDVDKETLSATPVKVIQLENCAFSDGSCYTTNTLMCTTAFVESATNLYPEVGCSYEFLFESSSFANGSGSLAFLSTCKAVVSDCQFIGSRNTALQASSSNIFFKGNNLFEKNYGFNGGAMSLLGDSKLFLLPNTNITFRGNHAHHTGGAIYVNDFKSFFSLHSPCFFQPQMPSFDFLYGNPNISIYMEDNTANYSGSSLYGFVDECITYRNDNTFLPQIFESIFHFLSPNESDFFVIASDPTGVCMCADDKPQCGVEPLHLMEFPGTLVVIPAVAVGDRNGVVRDGVIVVVQLDGLTKRTQESVCTDKTISRSTLCQDVHFRLYSPNGTVLVTLLPDSQEGAINAPDKFLQVYVDVLPCPVGFQLQQLQQPEQYTCTCDHVLLRRGISCSIDTVTIQRPPETWIGTNCTNLTDYCGVIIHDHCPLHYCKIEELKLHLDKPDDQCNLNHSGILCGGCKPGYSLVLGTSRCSQCSNRFLSLLLAFAVTGLALVLLLTLCNMTVSTGTINGLILYANIVGINSAIFFPIGQGNQFTSFLSVFIAWCNLDLGIETCFYGGMDMYQKTWLQFAFPLYIWAIVLFLITTTHYSTLASKVLVRRNAVKTLATLFLLSFAKLLRTTIAAFSYVILVYPDGSHRAVWLYDGNIDFLSGKHIPLFVVALLVFVLLLLPYTVVLTFGQCIQRKSSHPLFSWYTKLRLQPFFDAYAGPYKNSYRFWSGLLVIIRAILFLVFALNALGNPNINILAISAVTTLLFGSTLGLSIYKQWPLNMLESFFHVNLSLLSVGTLYVQASGGSQTAVTGTLVGLAFTSFVATLFYHTYQELKTSKMQACMQMLHMCVGWKHLDDQSQQVKETDEQTVPRSRVQHWEMVLGDPEGGEACLMPRSSDAYPQPTQSNSSENDHRLQPHYRPPESPICPQHHMQAEVNIELKDYGVLSKSEPLPSPNTSTSGIVEESELSKSHSSNSA